MSVEWKNECGSYSFLPLVSYLYKLGQLVLSFWTSNNLYVDGDNNICPAYFKKVLKSESRIVVLEKNQTI